MSFFNRKKKNKLTVTAIPPQVLIRKIIYDSGCSDPEAVAVALGLSPVSEEVAEMEEQASFDRVARIAALLPILEAHAHIAAQVAAASYTTDLEGVELPEEVLGALVTIFKFVSFASAMTCLSSLVDMNILNEKYRS